jgi:hypothetical protein
MDKTLYNTRPSPHKQPVYISYFGLLSGLVCVGLLL